MKINMRVHILKVCHVGWLLHHLFATIYGLFVVDYSKTTDDRVIQIKEYSLRYFTTWNFLIQTIFLMLSVTIDLAPSENKTLKKIKGYMYNTFVAPSTLFVSGMFWILYHIDRELVYPAECDNVIPFWLNHCTHTNIMGVFLVETLLGENKLPTFKNALIGLSVFSLAYDAVYLYTFFSAGRWLYGVYYILNWHERILFMIFTYAASVLALKGGMSLQNYRRNSKLKKVL